MLSKELLIKINFVNLLFRFRLMNDSNFKFITHFLSFQTEQKVKVLKYLVPLEQIATEDPSVYLLAIMNGRKEYVIIRFLHDDMLVNDVNNLDFVKKYHLEKEFDYTLPYEFFKFLYNDEELKRYVQNMDYKVTVYDEEVQNKVMYLYHKGMQIGAISLFLQIKESVIQKIVEYNLKKEKKED